MIEWRRVRLLKNSCRGKIGDEVEAPGAIVDAMAERGEAEEISGGDDEGCVKVAFYQKAVSGLVVEEGYRYTNPGEAPTEVRTWPASSHAG